MKISLNLSNYKIYYTSYFNTKKIIKLPKMLTAKKLEVDNIEVVGISGSMNKSLYY